MLKPVATHSVGEFCRAVRGKHSQVEWSKLTGYSQAFISQVESNRHRFPTMYLKSILVHCSKAEVAHLRELLHQEIDFDLGL